MPLHGLGQPSAVGRVGNVARQRDGRTRCQPGDQVVEQVAATAVDDQGPAAAGQLGGQGPAQAKRCAGDECYGHM